MEVDPVLKMEQERILKQRSKDDVFAECSSDIKGFFTDKTIFITGGTGFLGKHLVEKLLRSCPKLKRIYLLFRPKKGKNSEQRFKELFENKVFIEVKRRYPNIISKVHFMEGDVAQLNLGMSENDRQIFTKEVQIIFHGAATIRFDDILRRAMMINVRGTRELFRLASSCESLESMVHVSTAFCHYPLRNVKEQFYPMILNYESLIELAEKLDDEKMNAIAPTLLAEWGVNTYTYTKAMCEDIVKEYSDRVPVSIFRPAMVLPAYTEPMPGWVEPTCIYSATGILLGAGLGVIKVILADDDVSVDIIPVDFVTNTSIAVAWKTAEDRKNQTKVDEPKIYTLNSAKTNTINWAKVRKILESDCIWMASPKILWHGWSLYISNQTLFLVLAFLFHTIPATIIDGICWCFGKKINARQLDSTLTRLLLIIKPFTHYNYDFDDTNSKELFTQLSETDKQIFPFNVKDINWSDYIQVACLGLRRYVVRDNLQGTEIGVRKIFWLRIAHYILTTVLILIVYTIFKNIGSVLSLIFS